MDNDRARKLVAEILAGNKARFAELLDAYQKPVYNLAWRLTGGSADQAADLSQEIFIRAWLKLSYYDPSRPLFTWLYSLALNVIRNRLGRNQRLLPAVLGPQPEQADNHPDSDPALAFQHRHEHDELQAALQQLPLQQREALLLRYYQETPYADLAAILEISQSAAKMRVRRGLEHLGLILARSRKM